MYARSHLAVRGHVSDLVLVDAHHASAVGDPQHAPRIPIVPAHGAIPPALRACAAFVRQFVFIAITAATKASTRIEIWM